MNVGVLRFRFIDDEMSFQKTIRDESLDFIYEHNTADNNGLKVVSVRILISPRGRVDTLCVKLRRAASR